MTHPRCDQTAAWRRLQERFPQQGEIGLPLAANLLAWPALKRKAYRLDPSFAT